MLVVGRGFNEGVSFDLSWLTMIETSVEAAEETRDLSSMLSPLFVAYYSAFLQTLTLEFFMIISRFQQQKN